MKKPHFTQHHIWEEDQAAFWADAQAIFRAHQKSRCLVAAAKIKKLLSPGESVYACPDGKRVFLDARCPQTRRLAKNIAKAAGFRGKIIFSKH